MRRALGAVAVLVCLGLLAPACSDGDQEDAPDGGRDDGAKRTEPALDGCELVDAGGCLLPFPNDAFTVAADTPTGRRLRLPAEGMPTAVDGSPIASEDMDRSDGFSPGSAVLVHVPGLDPAASGLPDSTDIGASLDEDAPLVLLDVETGERVAWWAELDAHAPPDEALLMVHPAAALAEGHRYAVGLRDLVGADGQPLPASAAWTEVVEGTFQPQLRQEHLRGVEAALDDAVGDADWWLAWDFTVASSESLSGRLRHIRDEAYAELGQAAPPFDVEQVDLFGEVRVVRGTYEVPLFLTAEGPGGRFALGPDGLPERGDGVQRARFVCVVPLTVVEPATPVVYGHGLLGSAEEVESLAAAVPLGNLMPCATDWVGMSRADLPVVEQALGDLSRFPAVADRLQQGHLAMSFLGRLLNHPAGFASDPVFQIPNDGAPVFAVGDTQFVGNSQGGILGGAASAVSTEWSRAVLGVPGMGYSLLLPRSIDWDPFAATFTAAYTDPTEQVLALQLVQLLWDRGENQGYAQHLTSDPYPGIEAKEVLLVEAFGDHQVANVSTERLARTIGARAHVPVLGEGRSPVVEPFWGIEPLGADRAGSAIVLWDFGTPAPPVGNEAPRSPAHGDDPHGAGISEPRVLAQAFGFLRTGVTDDVCGGPCTSTAS